VSALKQGWAAELKRQAAAWEAAAAGKQEAWRVAKLAEIKEQTVKVCGVGGLGICQTGGETGSVGHQRQLLWHAPSLAALPQNK
jgi:hypothetical protein